MDFSASLSVGPRAQKRKTYGKKTTTSTYTISHHEESPPKPGAARAVWSPEPSPTPTSPSRTPNVKSSIGKLKRPSPKRPQNDDLFDVPSSDNEHANGATPQRRRKSTSPVKRAINTSVSESKRPTRGSDEESKKGSTKKRKRDANSAEVQLLDEAARSRFTVTNEPMDAKKRHSALASLHKTGAIQRGKAENKSIKRLASPADIIEEEEASVGGRGTATSLASALKTSASTVTRRLRSQTPEMALRPAGNLRNPLSPVSSKGTASPAKRTRFEDGSSPRTPPFRDSASPASFPRSGSVTPRQSELWTKLLGRSEGMDTPSNLQVKGLRITSASAKHPRATNLLDHRPERPKKARLIDTLANTKRSAAAADDDYEGSSAEEDDVASAVDPSSSKALPPSRPPEPDVPSAPAVQSGARVTYGQTRSYVEESGVGADLLWDDTPELSTQPSSGLHSSQATLSQRFGKFPQDDEDLEDGQGAMRTVHELRAAGENRRFADEFENALDDIQHRGGASLSRQRTGLMDMCDKLMDKTYVARMIDAGLDGRLLQACQGLQDTVFNWAVAVAIALIAKADVPRSVLERIHRSGCFEALFAMFELPIGITHYAKLRESNMSKAAQASLREFSGRVQATPELSPKQASLMAIDQLVRHMRSSGYMDDLLDEQKTSKLLLILQQCMDGVGKPQGTDVTSLELSLSILEAGSVIPGRIQTAWTPRRMERLATLLPDVMQLGAPFPPSLKLLALRLTLNLTNTNAKASNIFARPQLVQVLVSTILGHFTRSPVPKVPANENEEEDAAIDDELILALGALINLTEFADAARIPLLDPARRHLLDGLVAIFLENRGKAAEADTLHQTASNVAYGYLTVLLGNFCQNADVRRATAAQLPGHNLLVLIEAIEEFVAYNKVADRSAFDGEEGANVYRVFTERLAEVAARLRKAESAILDGS